MGTRRFRWPWRRAVAYEASASPVPSLVSWEDAPSSADRLHCLFCHSSYPQAIHLLDEASASFCDAAGDEYTLPRFVPVCDGCERLSAEGERAVLAQLMRVQNPYEDEADNIVETFHRASRESRRLGE